jgi:thiol-disulfide isomerase/thioredoxin
VIVRVIEILCLTLIPLLADGQTLRVELQRLTTVDDPTGHLETVSKTPYKPVRLPKVDTTQAEFLKVFYSWDVTDDPAIVIMRIRESSGDRLFIDLDYDDDLSNDGTPSFFPNEQNEFSFNITRREDPRQKVKLLLLRRRNNRGLPESVIARTMDAQGNLTREFATAWAQSPDFRGDFGTFYWDDRVTLRRGAFNVGTRSIAIGLFDLSNNGLFTDKEDLLLVDVYGTGNLSYNDKTGVFAVNDVFTIAGQNYKVSKFDEYGTWMDLEAVGKESTFYFLSAPDSLPSSNKFGYPFIVEPAMWQIEAKTIEGASVSLSSFQGEYLLLNFWGEWCKPCLEEIPVLIKHSQSTYQRKIQLVSFLKTKHPETAKEIIKDKGMHWPQLLMTRDVEKRFKIFGYPTNILVSPDGKTCIRDFSVDDKYFGENLR